MQFKNRLYREGSLPVAEFAQLLAAYTTLSEQEQLVGPLQQV